MKCIPVSLYGAAAAVFAVSTAVVFAQQPQPKFVTGQAARDPAAPRMLIEAVKRPADGWEWKGRVQ